MPGKTGKSAQELNIQSMEITTNQLFAQQINGGYKLPVMQLGNIHVMGDMNSRNLSEMKAYSKVEV